MIKIAYHPIYEYPLPEGHRFPMEKYGLLKAQLLHEGIFDEKDFFTPEALDTDSLLLTHTELYLQKLLTQQLSAKEIRKIGFPMTPLLVERGRHIANGTFQCCLYALEFGVSLNIAGGTHHSYADHGEGFCIFNDMAVAARLLLHRRLAKKIVFVDLDVHQGNGSASIFQNDERVFTFSMHGEKNYPLHKEKSDLDVALADHTRDDDYLKILKENLYQIIEKEKPDFIFYQSGVDILQTDKLGRLDITPYGCRLRDEIVFESARKYEIPIVATMGGGYSPDIRDILNAHANTYKVARSVFT